LASTWSNYESGQIFELLANHDSAVAVLLIDEVDKIQVNSNHPIVPTLLDLLEAETARKFMEESIRVSMDASRLIVLMTSNAKENVDAALRSRAACYDILEPDAEQKMEIALNIHNKLVKDTRKKLMLDMDAVSRLPHEGMDLRELHRVIRSAFVRAVIDKKKMVTPIMDKPSVKRRIGF
jgi:ATP-dependent Lon protease